MYLPFSSTSYNSVLLNHFYYFCYLCTMSFLMISHGSLLFLFFFQVRCLDFIDFGVIKMPCTLPRIKVWKSKLIKVFSDMYLGTDGKYGAFPVRQVLQHGKFYILSVFIFCHFNSLCE
jgi:hypothetical protein